MMEIYLPVTSDIRDHRKESGPEPMAAPLGSDNSVYGDLEFSSP